MVPISLRVLAALGLVLPLAGCVAEDPPAEIDLTNTTAAPTCESGTLPNGTCFVPETNKTEEGVGGVDHKHDYWKGQDKDVLFDDTVYFSAAPVFPDGEGSSPRSVAYVKLPSPKLVYEGASLVQVLATSAGFALVDEAPPAPVPAPPKLELQYRTAVDAAWREPLALAYDTPLDLPVAPLEADMPHSVTSLWVFRITTDQPIEGYNVKLTITAFKGDAVADWPGHPDFYADKDVRVVLDRDVETHMSGIAGSFLYDQGGTWVTPEKLVSYGTTRLEVFVNVTGIRSQTGQAATGYFLESHNATVIGPEVTFGDRWGDVDQPQDLKAWNFTIPVTTDGMDGPYQPASRWGFRAMATFADLEFPEPVGGGIGLCPGCFDYDIRYHVTVLAVHEKGTTGL